MVYTVSWVIKNTRSLGWWRSCWRHPGQVRGIANTTKKGCRLSLLLGPPEPLIESYQITSSESRASFSYPGFPDNCLCQESVLAFSCSVPFSNSSASMYSFTATIICRLDFPPILILRAQPNYKIYFAWSAAHKNIIKMGHDITRNNPANSNSPARQPPISFSFIIFSKAPNGLR